MNQPVDDRIKKLEDRMDKVEQVQQTEPINVRIERGLPAPEATVLQTVMDMVGKQGPDIGTLKNDVGRIKNDVEGIKADIKSINATLSDYGEQFKKHDERLIRIEARLETMATRDDVRKIEVTQEAILKLLRQKS